jgi:hypothetical protein
LSGKHPTKASLITGNEDIDSKIGDQGKDRETGEDEHQGKDREIGDDEEMAMTQTAGDDAA